MITSEQIEKGLPRVVSAKQEITGCGRTGLPWFWQVIALCAAIALILWRQPDAILHPQFFAEDGKFWFADAYNDGWAISLLRPLNGYFQTLPRLAAALALLAPMALAPLVMNLAGLLVQLLPVPVLVSSRTSGLGTLPLRATLAFTYLAIPNCSETHVAVNGGQWHLALVACLLLLASAPSNPTWKIFDVSVFVVCGLTGPFGILLIPVAIVRLWLGRDQFPRSPLYILCATSAIQVIALATTNRQHWPLGASMERLVRILGSQVFLGTIFGSNWLARCDPLAYVIFVAIAGSWLTIYCFLNANHEWKLFLLYSLAVLAASLWNPFTPVLHQGSTSWGLLAVTPDIRYWFFPTLAFAWTMVWYLFEWPHRPVCHRVGFMLVVLMLTGIRQDWTIPPRKDVHFASYVEKIKSSAPGTVVTIPQNPDGWSLRLVKR